MDTSTLSQTEVEKDVPLTSAAYQAHPQPAAEWFTRLISPLTDKYVSSVSRAASSSAIYPSPSSSSSSHSKNDESSSPVAVPLVIVDGSSARDAGSGSGLDPFPIYQGDMELVDYPQIPRAVQPGRSDEDAGVSTMLLVIIPVLVVVLTVLLGLVMFLVAMLYMRRKRGIRLTEDGGPLDLSKGDGVVGEGGTEGVESRWLEGVDPDVRDGYRRAKDWQSQYPPASIPTDITLSQFLSIQEKGVSAWSFEPDYEDNLSLYVQSRTEITFLADGPGMPAREGGGNSVLANLPLPKLNEVYYWEVKVYEKPTNTEIAIGLATKPYPSFRLPGWNRYSVAYFATDGFKAHNYPFTAASHGPPLNEGDVLGVGYRPRTGTVFFTRNGRKMDDAYTGLQRLNLFPTIGANGPCTVHVNLGQAGFVFIEANVKKWGLAPMVGTLAPPPAYGSERGSILLDAGYGTPHATERHLGVNALLEAARARSAQFGSSFGSNSSAGRAIPGAQAQSPRSSNSSRRHRRAGKAVNLAGSVPAVPSPLRASEAGPGPTTAGTRRRALGRTVPGDEDGTTTPTYLSPTDTPQIGPRVPEEDALENLMSEDEDEEGSVYDSISSAGRSAGSQDSPMEHNPPTPNLLDISLHSLRHTGLSWGGRERPAEGVEARDRDRRRAGEGEGDGSGSGESGESDETARPSRMTLGAPTGSPPPPGYAPLDPHVYASGLPADLPEDMINQAIAAMSSESEPLNSGRDQAPATPTPAPRRGRMFGWLSSGANGDS